MAADEGFLLGAWLKNSRMVASWDGSTGAVSKQLADFYEWNSRVRIWVALMMGVEQYKGVLEYLSRYEISTRVPLLYLALLHGSRISLQ